MQKKGCGNDDCPTCGDVCVLPRMNDSSCSWDEMNRRLWKKFTVLVGRTHMPNWRKRGAYKMIKNLPYPLCVE
ncbi:unnamed protein product [Soboliphyme baturini]|uniref:YkgJ family cysteine cluster protein n=1 Tax=Soboliphyme baturini TaxID=241478 RepID=A0A183J5T2_9BILA|nr:unnamed protein product [Soboliphyme baturini]